MARKRANVDRQRCVACGECEYTCPKVAISVKNGVTAVVDTEKCVGCGLCAKNCPADCITMEERE